MAKESWFIMGVGASAGEFVTPGSTIEGSADSTIGHGVAAVDDRLVATRVGKVSTDSGTVSVEAAGDGPRTPQTGDVVIAEVNRLQAKTAEIRILHVEGQPPRDIPAEELFADLFVAAIVDRFLPAPGDAMRVRDLVRAEITQTEPILRATTKNNTRYGVLQAICPACGELLESSDAAPDENVCCPRCDYTAFRALSDDFGAAFSDSGSGLSKLNRPGERWSKAAEERLSHDGERPYLSPLADHRRGEQHKPSAEGLRMRGGRRPRRPREAGDVQGRLHTLRHQLRGPVQSDRR